jgi:hypothetical protein
MKEFKKSSKLDNVLYDVRGPVVEEADRMIARGIEVLKLNIGNPAPFGFRAPEEVIYDMAANLRESEGYSNSKGIWAARKAIMQYAQTRDIPNLSMDDIYTGNGASELINLCMSALLDDGDEILILCSVVAEVTFAPILVGAILRRKKALPRTYRFAGWIMIALLCLVSVISFMAEVRAISSGAGEMLPCNFAGINEHPIEHFLNYGVLLLFSVVIVAVSSISAFRKYRKPE